jgi:hypothetical protein
VLPLSAGGLPLRLVSVPLWRDVFTSLSVCVTGSAPDLRVASTAALEPHALILRLRFHTLVVLSDVEASLKALSEKLEWIIRRLNYLKSLLTESQKHPEVIGFLQSLILGTALYGEPLKILSSLVSARRPLESAPQRDEVSRIIINTIALKGPRNISQLAREVQGQRGKASRTTVRKRVQNLLRSKALIRQGSYYRLAE